MTGISKTWAAIIAAVTWLVTATAGQACSPAREYVRPTNYELVGLADAIVVARAEASIAKPGDESDPNSPQVRFRVERVIKGSAPPTLELGWGRLGRVAAGDPGELLEPHPESMHGGCNRYTFTKGGSYVLFLGKAEDGSLRQYGFPFARVNEDYFGETSLWVRTIREYLDIQTRFAPAEQLPELERRHDALAKQPKSRERDQRMADIEMQLLSRSQHQPTEFLIATYETLSRGEVPRFDQRFKIERYRTPEEQRRDILLALVKGDHPRAAPFFERLAAKPDRTAAEFGAALRYFAERGEVRRAYDLFLAEGLPRLAALPDEEGLQIIGDTVEAMSGPNWYGGKARWQEDPVLATAWPETALGLYWIQRALYGEDNSWPMRNALEAIPVTDYRARPRLTLALVAGHDQKVLDWAIGVLMDDAVRTTWEAKVEAAGTRPVDFEEIDNPARLPIQVLVVAFGEERDAAIERVYCQSRARRYLLIQAVGDWGDGLDEELLTRFAADPGLDSDQRRVLGRAAALLYARTTAHNEPNRFFAVGRGYDEMKAIVSGGKVEAEPIKCPSTAR